MALAPARQSGDHVAVQNLLFAALLTEAGALVTGIECPAGERFSTVHLDVMALDLRGLAAALDSFAKQLQSDAENQAAIAVIEEHFDLGVLGRAEYTYRRTKSKITSRRRG